MTVYVDRAVYDAMIVHIQQAAPREGCGLLAGPRFPEHPQGEPAIIDTWLPMRNVAEHPRARFEMEPAALLHAWEILAAEGRRPWVVVHSHVTTDARPSPHDIRYATDPTLLHMVVSLAAPTPYAWLWEIRQHETDRARRLVRRTVQLVGLGKQELPATDLTRDVSGD